MCGAGKEVSSSGGWRIQDTGTSGHTSSAVETQVQSHSRTNPGRSSSRPRQNLASLTNLETQKVRLEPVLLAQQTGTTRHKRVIILDNIIMRVCSELRPGNMARNISSVFRGQRRTIS